MQVRLNGEAREIAAGTSVAALLEALGLRQKRIAVELNRTIVEGDAYAEHILGEGDEIEIVHFVGGG